MGVIDTLLGPRHKVAKAPTTVSREPKYMELEWKSHSPTSNDFLRVLPLGDFSDVEGILDYVRERNSVVILKVKPRLVQEKMELKRALKRIQRVCQAVDGDIAGVREDIIAITPSHVTIVRPGESLPQPIGIEEPTPTAEAAV